MSLRSLFDKDLSEEELNLLPNSFDLIGDILIFSEVDKKLAKKEKFIGNKILEHFSNVKVVAKKIGLVKGKFRTRKIKIIAGENRKDTLYKENGVSLKLNVETSYFSPRLATERLRIAKGVKDGETILVMFAGVLPYPLVIYKNANANFIYAVEANSEAYKYGLENIKLNKADNIKTIKGDVRKALKNIFKDKTIGLKSHWNKEDLISRLKKKPKLVEFYMRKKDLDDNLNKLIESINFLKKKKVMVMLHQPTHYRDLELTLASDDKKVIKNALVGYKILHKICHKNENVLGFIMHPAPKVKAPLGNLIYNLKHSKYLLEHAFIENIPRLSEEEHLRILSETRAKNACIDPAHYFLINKSNPALINFVKKIRKRCNTYFHLCDSNGSYFNFNGELADAMNIGEGLIDFNKLLDFVDIGVIEVLNNDERNPIEAFKGYEKIKEVLENKKVDRIVMPLPKNAGSFLGITKDFVKKGTVINFYDFQTENDFSKSLSKIKKVYKKFKVLEIVKCGQISPGKYRICIDFEIDF